jgi:glycosyltransferase involved in cell wall biosynthesis
MTLTAESTAGRPSLDRLVVVIPAHNEEDTLGACLDSVRVAAAAARTPTDIVLVLDDCSDSSLLIAERHPEVTTVAITAASVGAARAAGAAAALAGLQTVATEAAWIATTDADCVVPPEWLVLHEDLADGGADVVLGAVVPVLDDLDEARASAWRERHWPGATLGHVHGANLGVRASAYRRAGGFLPTETDEDVEFVGVLRSLGVSIVATEDNPVVTSARLRGRVPRGYADYLTALGREDGATGQER